MSDYRVYTIHNGHVLGPADVVTCDNDEQAIDSARKLNGCFAVEIWEAARLVAKIDACADLHLNAAGEAQGREHPSH